MHVPCSRNSIHNLFTILQVPSAWQKPRPEEDGATPQFDFDLAIVGGGVGGAYLVSRLQEEFVIKRGQPMPKIALFERSDKMGGRLMSGYGAGALNLGVGPMTKELYTQPEPMPEYGGMRINPQLYPLVMNRIAYFSRVLFGEHSCPIPGCDFNNPTEKRNCCPKMLKRMVVGDIRYVRRPSFGLYNPHMSLPIYSLPLVYHAKYVISDVSHLSMAHIASVHLNFRSRDLPMRAT